MTFTGRYRMPKVHFQIRNSSRRSRQVLLATPMTQKIVAVPAHLAQAQVQAQEQMPEDSCRSSHLLMCPAVNRQQQVESSRSSIQSRQADRHLPIKTKRWQKKMKSIMQQIRATHSQGPACQRSRLCLTGE